MSNHSDKVLLPNTDSSSSLSSFFHHDSSSSSSNTFNSTSNHFNNQSTNEYSQTSQSQSIKETGIIEKMLVSYGFIQCCDRQARLFFHFSQYSGNTDHLKIGDPVEYETSYDRRTGKPVAINIKKIASNDFMSKISQTERVTGVIATELSQGREGRVAFENNGEFFFLPFTHEDITNNVTLKAKDNVSFILYADGSGNFRATNVTLESSNSTNNQGVICTVKDTFGFIERSDNKTKIFFHSSECADFKALNIGDFVQFDITTRRNKELAVNVCKQINSDEELSEKIYKGRVNNFSNRSNLASGFIHCPELDKEFFFYEKDVKGSFTIYPSDLVTFQIATDRRTQHERAVNIAFLSETFIINKETRERGYVASMKETYGFIKCPSKEGSLIYFKFTELVDPTIILKLNDEVEFTYKGDALMNKCQAIRISILPNGTLFNNIYKKPPNTTTNNSQQRLNATTNHLFSNNNKQQQSIREDYSLIDLTGSSSSTTNYLHFNNNISNNNTEKDTPRLPMMDHINDVEDINHISSIKYNGNNGDVLLNSNWTKEMMDAFQQQPTTLPQQQKSQQLMNHNNDETYGSFFNSFANSNGNVLEFSPELNTFMNNSNLINNLMMSTTNNVSEDFNLPHPYMMMDCVKKIGIIVNISENFGFIESLDGEQEYHFQMNKSTLSKNDDDILLGKPVEFDCYFIAGRWKATNVNLLINDNSFCKFENDLSQVFIGNVTRTLKTFSEDELQEEYTGLITKLHNSSVSDINNIISNGGITTTGTEEYEFSTISLKYLKDYISLGDQVKFQVATNPITKKPFAYNVEVVRERLRGTLCVVQKTYGFLKHAIYGNIYYNAAELQPNCQVKFGDKVEFYYVKNKKTERSYAIDIRKITWDDTQQNMERTLFKNLLQRCQDNNGPKVIAIRQPKAPDGTKGFNNMKSIINSMNHENDIL